MHRFQRSRLRPRLWNRGISPSSASFSTTSRLPASAAILRGSSWWRTPPVSVHGTVRPVQPSTMVRRRTGRLTSRHTSKHEIARRSISVHSSRCRKGRNSHHPPPFAAHLAGRVTGPDFAGYARLPTVWRRSPRPGSPLIRLEWGQLSRSTADCSAAGGNSCCSRTSAVNGRSSRGTRCGRANRTRRAKVFGSLIASSTGQHERRRESRAATLSGARGCRSAGAVRPRSQLPSSHERTR